MAALPEWLAELPRLLGPGVGVVVVLRHGERERLPQGMRGDDVRLTAAGRAGARALGAALPAPLESLRASVIRRSIETAECLRAGAEAELRIETSAGFGGPGPFVVDEGPAWDAFWRLGKHRLIRELLADHTRHPGFRDPAVAAQRFVDEATALARHAPGLHLVVSHDLILAGVVGALRGAAIDDDRWPGFLDGVIFEVTDGRLRWRYRDLTGQLHSRKTRR